MDRQFIEALEQWQQDPRSRRSFTIEAGLLNNRNNVSVRIIDYDRGSLAFIKDTEELENINKIWYN